MGELQTEIWKQRIWDRFETEVTFAEGEVLYKETIVAPVEGVGHFEPLRHYAEVHLLLEPLPAGSGLQFVNQCSRDALAVNWQQQIMRCLRESEWLGVLSGSPLTDLRMTLLSGRAHPKHTDGGDFREATLRAVRQGLMSTRCIMLEPYDSFRMEIPTAFLSRAIYDIEQRGGSFTITQEENAITILQGTAPVARMRGYAQELAAATKGKGKLLCTLHGYEPLADRESEEVIAAIGYDAAADMEHPSASVFCAHGAGFIVPWDQVREHMHVHTSWSRWQKQSELPVKPTEKLTDDDEDAILQQIFQRTYGTAAKAKKKLTDKETYARRQEQKLQPIKPECVLVDGYNVMHAWSQLEGMMEADIERARAQLIDAMCSYQGYKHCELILVFDAYRTDAPRVHMQKEGGIYVVYTKQAQTADAYIEQTTHHLAEHYRVRVVTSDGMEQLITSAQGAMRMSSRQLLLEYEQLHERSLREAHTLQKRHRTYLLEDLRKYQEDEDN